MTEADSPEPASPGVPRGLSLSAWCVAAAFGTYFCMYGFRKPFTAATYDDITFSDLGYKTILVTAQVLGYTVSKFIGIKVIAEMPPQLLEAVIAHELAHLRRCDLWVNLLQRLVESVLFYHPAVWWLSSRLRRERELCCDALAVAATGERLAYAEALQLTAELTARLASVDGRPALAAGLAAKLRVYSPTKAPASW